MDPSLAEVSGSAPAPAEAQCPYSLTLAEPWEARGEKHLPSGIQKPIENPSGGHSLYPWGPGCIVLAVALCSVQSPLDSPFSAGGSSCPLAGLWSTCCSARRVAFVPLVTRITSSAVAREFIKESCQTEIKQHTEQPLVADKLANTG